MVKAKNIDEYISKAPKKNQDQLVAMRKIMRSVAPKATESITYMMPAYDNGRLAWFAAMKGYTGLYLRPPIIHDHAKDLAKYVTTKSAIHFPLDEKLPVALIKKLLRARIKKNKAK